MTVNINVGSIFLRPIQLTRRFPGNYNNKGKFEEPTPPQVMTIQASVQPVPNDQYRFLPEGDSPAKFRIAYSNFLFEEGTHSGQKPDEILVDGVTYRLFTVIDWIFNGYSAAIFRSVQSG